MKLYVMTNEEAMDIWMKEFPILSKFNASTVFAKSDIMLIGLRFQWTRPSYYDVSLEFVPLWNEWKGVGRVVFHCFLRCPNGTPELVGYTENNRGLILGVERAHKDFGPFLREKVSLKDLLQLNEELKMYNYKQFWWLKNDPFIISSYLRLRMALAAYSNNSVLIDKTKQQIIDITEKWDDERVKFLYDMTVEEWKRKTFSMCEDREGFLRQIEINRARPRIAKLKSIKITGLDISAAEIPELNETFRSRLRDSVVRFFKRYILGVLMFLLNFAA